ncbi:MAG: lipase family protein [Acidobacteriota bacterium]|nr:lipase family protein [Acidobacteriota bacterium]
MEAVVTLPGSALMSSTGLSNPEFPPGYKSDEALVMARACRLVYQFGDCLRPNYLFKHSFYRDLARIRRQANELGYQMTRYVDLGKQMRPSFMFWYHFVKPGPVFAVLLENDKEAVLAFRGTVINSAANWLADFDFRTVPAPTAGRVHLGFTEALDFIWSEIEPWLLKLDKPLKLTGHSLGSALAVLTAARLADRVDIASITAIAQPRLGDRRFMDWLDQKFGTRYLTLMRHTDLVTVAPFHLLGYHHGRNIGLFDGPRLVTVNREVPHWEDKLDHLVISRFLHGLAFTGLPDEDDLIEMGERFARLIVRQETGTRGLSIQTMGLFEDWLGDLKHRVLSWQHSRNSAAYIAATHDIRSYETDIEATA